MYYDYTSEPVPAAYRGTPQLPPLPPFITIEDWKGELFWKAMDPYGYQYLSHILLRRRTEDIQLIFSELKDQICVLMLDRLGRYVIRYLCEVCDEQQMNQLVSSATADVHLLMLVCLNSIGSESMMDFLWCLRTPEQISDVISALQRLTAPLVNHRIGSLVISHCFHIFPVPAKETKPILDAIADIFFEMATNQSGSDLLGILISKAFLLESRPSILSKIIADVHQLSRHPFGSNVVQYVIRLRMHDVERDIVAQLRGDFALLSMNRYATRVVLTLIYEYKEKLAPQIVDEIIQSPNFSRVLQDPYGKYVLECAKECTTETARETLNLASSESCMSDDQEIRLPFCSETPLRYAYDLVCLFDDVSQ